jgi:hypothetical protein
VLGSIRLARLLGSRAVVGLVRGCGFFLVCRVFSCRAFLCTFRVLLFCLGKGFMKD